MTTASPSPSPPPFGNFPAYLTRRIQGDFLLPSNYLKQFHGDFADEDDLNALLRNPSMSPGYNC